MTDHETEAWIADGLRYGAQMFWNGKTPKADPDTQAFKGSSHFGVWGVVLAWGRGLPDD